MTVSYREAHRQDAPLILQFIRELADYENLLHEVVASEELISHTLFSKEAKAFCIIAEDNEAPVGFALCFYNYSTFQGRPGIYIEDLYVRKAYRNRGIGKGFFRFLARKALHENCGRIQWWVLDWNEPSIKFYEKMGARGMKEWTVYRLEGASLENMAKDSPPDVRRLKTG